MFFQRFGVLSDYVIQAQVQLVEGESLLDLFSNLASYVIVGLFVIDLKTGKHWVLKAHVDTNNVIDESCRFVGFQGRGDGQPGVGIVGPVQNEDQLLFLDGPDHHGSTFGVDSQILSGDDPTASALAKSFQMNPVERIFEGIELQNDDSSGIRSDNDII